MNQDNYTSLEASKRLVENEIIIDTECYWVGEKAYNEFGWKVVTKDTYERNSYFFNKCHTYPAPSMTELWRELPDSITLGKMMGALCIFMNHDKSALVGYWWFDQPLYSTRQDNPTDALVDLLIWIRKESK